MILHTALQWLKQTIKEFVLTTDTPYLTLTGELWGVYYEDLGQTGLCYNGIALWMYWNKYTSHLLEISCCYPSVSYKGLLWRLILFFKFGHWTRFLNRRPVWLSYELSLHRFEFISRLHFLAHLVENISNPLMIMHPLKTYCGDCIK